MEIVVSEVQATFELSNIDHIEVDLLVREGNCWATTNDVEVEITDLRPAIQRSGPGESERRSSGENSAGKQVIRNGSQFGRLM
jgi:hypothetical protein